MSNDNVIPGEFEVTDEEIQSFVEETTWHAVLQVWRDVLAPAQAERDKKMSPQWASRIVASNIGLGFGDMSAFQQVYFTYLEEIQGIINAEIATDDECLNVTTPEEDLEQNAQHYKNLLVDWQKALFKWELDWDPDDPLAAVKLAAISEIHKLLFGNQQLTGLSAHLDNIKLEVTEADQLRIRDELNELREAAQ